MARDLVRLAGTPEEAYEIADLPLGLVFKVRPPDTISVEIAQARAAHKLARKREVFEDMKAEGTLPDGYPNLDDPAEADGLLEVLVSRELALAHIVEWNVGQSPPPPDGAADPPQPINEKTVAAVLGLWPVGESFYRRLLVSHLEILAAKKG